MGGDIMNVISRILFLMEREKVTGYELAKKSGISHSTISTIFRKNRQPNITTLQKICKGLNISMAEFFYEDDGSNSVENKFNSLSEKSKEIILYLLDKLD